MRIEFDIRISTKNMYHFLMSHCYRGVSGIVGVAAGVGLIAYYLLYAKDAGGGNPWIYLFFGVLFLIYQPWTLYVQAAKQTKLNPVFKEPLHYILTEHTLEVQQASSSNTITWDNVWQVCETGQSILIYTSQKNAFIWVKSQLGDEEQKVRELLHGVITDKRMKLKK